MDAKRILLFAVVAVVFLLVLGFPSPRALLGAVVPVTLSAWLLAAFMGWAGIELHFLTLAVVPILFGIGVDDGVHMVARLRRGESIETVLTEAGPGLVMTSLTTAAAFGSMLLAHNQAIREFGICGALGVLFCLIVSLHLLPLVMGLGRRCYPETRIRVS